MTFEELAKKRYSVRKFKDTEVEQEKLDKILSMNLYAPTAKNNQPQRIYVLKSKEALEKIRDVTKMTYNAPVVLLVCTDVTEAWVNPFDESDNTVDIDAAIVCTHMMMEATELGLGTVWVKYFDPKEVKRAFKLPDDVKPVSLLPIGYADAEPGPLHAVTKDLEDMVVYK